MSNSLFKHCVTLLNFPRRLILWLLLGFFAYTYLTANPPGYCVAQQRVISDEEICVSLFDAKLKEGMLQLSGSEITARAYFLNHPNHCFIDKSAMGRFRWYGLTDALFSDTMHASLTYKMSEKARKYYRSGSHLLWNELTTLTPCGKVLRVSGIEAD